MPRLISFLGLLLVGLLTAGLLAGCTGEGDRVQYSDDPYAYGERIYQLRCQTCHQMDGSGIAGAFPPLTPNEWVLGDEGRFIRLVLHGVRGEMEVDGTTYNGVMPGFGYLSDEEVAAVITYVRQSFGNDTTAVRSEQVAAVRAHDEAPRGGWHADDLWEATGIPTLNTTDAPDETPIAE